jgi:hypothetical protein
MSSLAKLLAPSRPSIIGLEPRLPTKEFDSLVLWNAKTITATIAADVPPAISGQTDAQTFDTYACMNGLWVYSRYSQTASSRLAADCMTNKGPCLERITAEALFDFIAYTRG